jgi:hypothetical protein
MDEAVRTGSGDGAARGLVPRSDEREAASPPADSPKGAVDVNAQRGIIQLRGEVESPELIDELVAKTRKIQGVLEVENLLHTPGTPAPMHR